MINTMLAVFLAIGVFLFPPQQTTVTSTVVVIQPAAGTTMASCPAVNGQTQFCFAADGSINISKNGGAWSAFNNGGSGGITAVSINGTTKGGPTASFTVAASAPSTTAPAITAK
jgi:hypothetical protein